MRTSNIKLNSFIRNLDCLFIFFLSGFVFYYILHYHIKTDIQVHAYHAFNVQSNQVDYPPNFLFYFLLNFFSFFSGNKAIIETVAISLLALSVYFKYVLSRRILLQEGEADALYRNNGKYFFYLILGLFFCFALPDPICVLLLKKFYLGRLVPCVWHNSTTIMVFPFALLLFWKQLKLLEIKQVPSIKEILIINVLVLINITIKPSFIFSYLPATFILLASRIKTDGLVTFLKLASPLLFSAALLFLQYIYIYIFQQGSFIHQDSSLNISTPFKYSYALWAPYWYLPVAFFLSLLLPLYSVIRYKDIFKFKPFQYAFLLFIIGLLISAFIYEDGPRMRDGNFTWQNVLNTYILMLSTVLFLIHKKVWLDFKKQNRIPSFLFLAHAGAGILYLLKILILKSYK